MSLVSTGFAIFLIAGLVIYYIIPKKTQWIWLLIMSYFYYMCSGSKTVVFIIATTIITFVAGVLLEETAAKGKNLPADIDKETKKIIKATTKRKKKIIVVILLLLDFGILAVLKYHNFAIENINSLIGVFTGNSETIPTVSLLLPLGISFYTFQSVSYIIDVYRGKYECSRNLFKFALFVSYFPQILQGPIGRYDRLAPQLMAPHYYSLAAIERGALRVCFGLFKKLVIADRAGVIATTVFTSPDSYGGLSIVLALLAYSARLYGDFAGGMDVVIGVSEMFGIEMDENFRQPFFSKSISEFWRRWHITLGTWMKDYIFYPFTLSKGMNRFGKFAKKRFGNTIGRTLPICLSDILIFFIVGVWHGAAWKFIIYGLYNGFIIAISSLLEPVFEKMFLITKINKNSRGYHGFQVFRTFILVNIGWYFDDPKTLSDSLLLMKNTVTGMSLSPLMDGSLLELAGGYSRIAIILLGCVVWLIVSILKEKNIDIRKELTSRPIYVRWPVYIALVMSIPLIGYISEEVGGFIYAQF